ncbi:hypothetical protein CBR_g30164 [Chara braunii]|uniref:Uncharacterized protein n=1 Tax=Chara braunii TaxID=69332 RepID=A0A388LC65_CHABU|nr:hypothetical protein CBR_g30164 [Chara braunii]|eukprot:GBG79899.1 hypothetical protein CBR_g30164 [Chara braunii]
MATWTADGPRWAEVGGDGQVERRSAEVGEGCQRWAEAGGGDQDRDRDQEAEVEVAKLPRGELATGRSRGGGGELATRGSGSGEKWSPKQRAAEPEAEAGRSGEKRRQPGRSGEKRKWGEAEEGGGGGDLATWRSCHVVGRPKANCSP